jgi:ABC-2 type transport system permease protein
MTSLTGTRALWRLALSRDRVRLPAWVLGISLIVVGTAASFGELFQTAEERAKFAAGIVGNAGFRAIYGPIFNSSLGGLTAWRIGAAAAVYAALMSLLLVVRHTRAEEEAGRSELLGATVVGRHAGLAAALIHIGIANLAVIVLVTLGFIATGLPASGSLAFGLALGVTGLVFGAVGAVAAQLATTGRGAGGLAGSLLGGAYVLRMIGDAGDGTLSWVSPIGWAVQTRMFADERWWVPALPLALTALLVPVAFLLVSRRDHGGGMLQEKPGPARASPQLNGPLGLAWRLQRGVLLGWTIGFVVAGGAIGAIASDVGAFGEQIGDLLRQVGNTNVLIDAYFAGVMSLFALASGAYLIQAVLRIRVEENDLRAEPILAGPVSRWKWAGPHLLVAVGGATLLMAAVGLGAGVAHGLRADDLGSEVPRLVWTALLQLPAAWTLGGLAFAFTGVLPRLTAVAWGAFGVFVMLGYVGELLDLPGLILDVSPFRHTPRFPVAEVSFAPLLILGALAVGLGWLGYVGIRRRDITSG